MFYLERTNAMQAALEFEKKGFMLEVNRIGSLLILEQN